MIIFLESPSKQLSIRFIPLIDRFYKFAIKFYSEDKIFKT